MVNGTKTTRPADAPRSRVRSCLLVFIGCLVLYHTNGAGHLGEVDCIVAPYAAWSLVRGDGFDVERYPALADAPDLLIIPTKTGEGVSKYPPGSSLAAMPFVAPYVWTKGEPPRSGGKMGRLGKRIAAVYVAGAMVLLYLICLRVAPGAATVTTLLAAAGTTLWSTASQALWAHGPATFFLTLSLFLLIRKDEELRPRDAALAGIVLGMAMLCRPTTALFGVASLVALATQRRWREVAALGAAVSVLGIALVAYNAHYFENVFSGGYQGEGSQWTTPLIFGLAGQLLAPSRGLLVYTPAFLILPFGILRLFERKSILGPYQRILLSTWLAAALLTIAAYAKWHGWWGGWSYGPRFLCEITPILALFFGLAFLELSERYGRSGRGVAWMLVVMSMAVQFVGVFGHDPAWMERNPDAASMFSILDNQIISSAKVMWTEEPLALILPAVLISGVMVYAWHARRSSLTP